MGLGMIIGVSAGGLVVLVAIAILITCLVRKKGAAAKRAQSAQGADPNGLEMGQSYGNPMGDGKKKNKGCLMPPNRSGLCLLPKRM